MTNFGALGLTLIFHLNFMFPEIYKSSKNHYSSNNSLGLRDEIKEIHYKFKI